MKALLTLGLSTCGGIVSYAHPDEPGKSGWCHARKRFFLALIPILLLLLGSVFGRGSSRARSKPCGTR